jgi:hypothetical protein
LTGVGYLSDIARRRIAAVLLVVGIAVAILALTDQSVFEDPPTEEQEVAMAVEEFYGAAADGDFQSYCEKLTEGARRTIESRAKELAGSEEDLECPDIAAAAAERFVGLRTKIKFVNVSGSRARVQVAVKPAEGASELRTVMLESPEAGVWLIADSG